MEVVEDDAFFAELSRQISLLIMDDEEDPVSNYSSSSHQGVSRAYPTAPSHLLYEQCCRRESKGTGVFIPQSSQPRRKSGQGKYNSFSTRSCKRPDKSRRSSNVNT